MRAYIKAAPSAFYPCHGHGVASTLARNDLLGDLLKLENQEQMGRRLREAVSRLR